MRPRIPRSTLALKSPARRLLAFVALQTSLVALLAAATGAVTDTAPFLATGHPVSVPASGPAASATVLALQWLLLVGVVLAAGPITSVYRARREERPGRAAVWWVAAVGGLAVVVWVASVVATLWSPAGAAAVLAATVAAALVGYRTGGGDPPDHGAWRPRPAVLGPLAGVVLVAAVLAVPAAVPGQHEPLVESEGFSAPAVEWAFDYEAVGDGRGVLTITHRGGDVVDADDLLLRGSGFADVPGANQTASGPWQGSVRESGSGVVAAHDSVAVGVEADCRLRLVYDGLVAVGEYTCPGG